ncbi:hypothetical protein [Candidatus Phytoplasma sp. AldY-WA1]|nr:hypothetical protein [Candidatus Phytoplasma sp. AldY-WA1]
MYIGNLKDVEKSKKTLVEEFKETTLKNKKIVIDNLNKIYQITN